MRVLAISSYGVLGGAEIGLVNFLRHRPADVEGEVLLVSPGPLAEALSSVGMPVRVAHGYEGRPDAARLVRFTRTLLALLPRLEPDVVWARGTKAALLAAPGCRLARVPLVWNKVDFSWDRHLAIPLGAAVDGVIGVSEAVTEPLGPLRRRRVLGAVGSPIALREELRAHPDPDAPRIGTLGRLIPYKGQHLILRAAALLAPSFPALQVIIAGGPVAECPEYADELRLLAEDLGIADRVRFTGFVADVETVLEQLTVYVNANHLDDAGFGSEGLGGGLLQASWAGVPVVAPAEGGLVEAVQDGITGTLIPRPDPPLIADAVARYLRDPELALRTGEAGRSFARASFAPAIASERLFSYLRTAASRRPR